MENTAKALLMALSYFELWDDDIIDPDTAIAAIESITAELNNSSPEEIKIISKVAAQLAKASTDEDEKEFTMSLLRTLALTNKTYNKLTQTRPASPVCRSVFSGHGLFS